MELSAAENKSLVPGAETVPPVLAAPPETPEEPRHPLVRGWAQLSRGRQIGLIAALALAVAMILATVLWTQKTEYSAVFGELPEKEAGEIAEALQKLNQPYRINSDNGAIEVPADQVHAVRLKLAGMGLPKESSAGFELLDKDSSFGVSQLVEGARYQHALEGEIARSIATIRAVKSARVHLALPKESVFVRQPKKPSASVVVELHPGNSLNQDQVEAIVHLVASSVPQLEPDQISVVDQRGRLLFSKEKQDETKEMNLTGQQFQFKRDVEEHLIKRVENILTPVVGSEALSTQVTADVDFTVTERTQELYNPDLPALRSEQTSEEQNRNAAPQGVPGALTNQPPPAGVAPELAGQGGQAGQTAAAVNTSKNATRNYELDKTVSHSRLGTGVIRRVTVAVVVDHRRIAQPDGTISAVPYSEEDLSRFNNLVKEAVGYDAARGDRVTVTNAAFRGEEAAPALKVWEEPWFWNAVKYGVAALIVLLVIFGVLRPAIKGLVGRGIEEEKAKEAAEKGEIKEGVLADGETGPDGEPLALEPEDDLLLLEAPQNQEKRIEFAQKAIDQDPKRVAQVIKNWMNPNGGS